MSDEIEVWRGEPSQVTNMGGFIILGLLSLFVITIPISVLWALWIFLVVKNQKYELTTQRLKTHQGVLSKKMDELELYRVMDTQFDQPFFLRLFGLGNVILVTSDKTSPKIKIKAVKDARELREKIRHLVEERRDKKRVRQVEYE